MYRRGWKFVPERVQEFKVEPAYWQWTPWCVQKSTFGGLTADEKKEKELHKKHQCTGRNFVKEFNDSVKEFNQRAERDFVKDFNESIKKLNESATWNHTVKHDPVQDMEVD